MIKNVFCLGCSSLLRIVFQKIWAAPLNCGYNTIFYDQL